MQFDVRIGNNLRFGVSHADADIFDCRTMAATFLVAQERDYVAHLVRTIAVAVALLLHVGLERPQILHRDFIYVGLAARLTKLLQGKRIRFVSFWLVDEMRQIGGDFVVDGIPTWLRVSGGFRLGTEQFNLFDFRLYGR